MKRILVTGANGFIGSYCLPLLADRGDEVHCVTSRSIAIADPEVHWHSVDLLDSARVTKLIRQICPTHLLHLAWNAKPGEFWQSAENVLWLESGLIMLQEFARCGGQRIVAAGTCAEYDWTQGICHESATAIRPSTVYGKCKTAMQLSLSALSSTNRIESAWARLFFLYGPGAPVQKFPGAVYHALAANQPALCSHGQQQRDFLYVHDAADALVKLLDSDVCGEVNVASGIATKLSEMALRIAASMGRQHLLQLGAVPSRPDEPPLLVADVNRLRNELKWTPSYTIEQGLSETIDWLERSHYARAA